MKISYFLLIIFFFTSLYSRFLSHDFSIADGLLNGKIRDVFQDKIGRIWTLTDNGVSVFDGFEFRNYRFPQKFDISYSIDGNCIDENICWILTDRGLLKYTDFGLKPNQEIEFIPLNDVTHFAVIKNKIWVSSNEGNDLSYLSSSEFKSLAVSNNLSQIKDLFIDDVFNLWIFCFNSVWKFSQQGKLIPVIENLSHQFNGFNCYSVIKNEDGFLLNNNKNSNLMLSFSGETQYSEMKINFHDGVFTDDNNFLFIKNSELYFFDGYRVILEDNSNTYTSLIKDKAGSIWLGKKNSLTLIQNPNVQMIFDDNDSKNKGKINSGFISKNKFTFSVNDVDGSVYEYKNGQFKKIKIPHFNYSFYLDDEFEFLISQSLESMIINKNSREIQKIESPKGDIQNVIKSKQSNRIIAKTSLGIFAFSNSKWTEIMNFKSNNKILESLKDQIYSIRNDSLFITNYAKEIKIKPLPNDYYKNLYIEDNWLLILGENNFYQMDLISEEIIKIENPNYYENKIQSIGIFNNKKWINCYNYLILETESKSKFYSFNNNVINEDILISYNNAYVFNENRIFELRKFKEPNKIGLPYFYTNTMDNSLNFNYNTDFPISIQFFTPNYTNLGFLKYFYILENSENYLVPITANKIIIPKLTNEKNKITLISNLDINRDIHYSKSVQINVKLPWYLKPEIIIILIILLLGILIGFFMIIYIKYIKNNKMNPLVVNTYINIFNKFEAYKKSSIGSIEKITSNTHKEMLFYLVLFGYKYKNGVDSEKFGTYFWPNLPHDKAINRRNVAFTRIRQLIGTEFSQIIYSKQNKCYMNWKNELLHIDILNYFSLIEKGLQYSKKEIIPQKIYYFENAIKIYGNGITKEFSDILFDKICVGIHEDAIKYSNDIIDFYQKEKDFDGLLKICDQRLDWDSFDVKMAEIKTSTLMELNKKIDANKFINSFSKSFEMEIGELPNFNNDLIKSLISKK